MWVRGEVGVWDWGERRERNETVIWLTIINQLINKKAIKILKKEILS